jgi:hypothetical protein
VKITVGVQTLQSPRLGESDPWAEFVERFTREAPRQCDFILLSEVEQEWGELLDERARADLGMKALISPKPRGSACAVLYRPGTAGEPTPKILRDGEILHHDRTRTTVCGWALAWWMLPVGSGTEEKTVPVGVCSFKFCPWSPDDARIAAAHAMTHSFQGGAFAVCGGDVNFPPANPGNPPPDWRSQSPFNRGQRALPGTARSADPLPNRSVAQQIIDKGWDDMAWELAQRTGDRSILRPTARDGFERIDQMYCTTALTPAITDYDTLQAPVGASDHHGLIAVLDLALAAYEADVIWT